MLAVVSLPLASFCYYYTFTLVKWPFCALDTIRMYLDRVQYNPYNKYILRECLGGTVDGTGTNTLEVTEERILDVAQRLFLEKGYENTTIQDIVNELGGLTKGAVYHHFKSQKKFLVGVVTVCF